MAVLSHEQAGRSVLDQAIASCRRHLAGAAGFSALVNLLYLTPTLYMLVVYDRVIPTDGLTTLILVSAMALLSLAVLAAFEWLRSRLLVRASARLEQALAGPVMDAVLTHADLSRVERAKAMRQFDILRHSLSGQGALAVFDAPWAPIYIVAAFLLHPAIGALCLASSAWLLGLAWLNERATRKPLERVSEAAAVAYARQDQASSLAAEARALGMTRALVANQLQEREALIDLQTGTSFVAVRYATLIRFSRLALQSAILGLGAYLTIANHISPGAVIAGSLLLSRALAPIEQVVGSWGGIVQARAAYAELAHLFARRAAEPPRMRLPEPAGRIALENVTCLTGDRERTAIESVNLSIEPGLFVGVLGLSGAGKSTLLAAIVGAAPTDKGCVRIDGASLNEWDGAQLARQIGYLPQDFALFSGSVRDNVSRFERFLGVERPEAIDARTVAAAQAAGVHETILSLPNGYQTQLGLGGTGLSAGQTQRIALARALYGDPRIVVLDEPNAHLDSEAELKLIETLAHLKARGATVLVAAHRGAILANADKLLLLSGGRVEIYGGLADVATEMRSRVEAAAAADQKETRRA